ncbi:MAG: hypothetical protein LBK69_02530 [Syntrophomonadaceae bacterium]|nr:hypothetical protein [Syntrophomonadaceae bacterium]
MAHPKKFSLFVILTLFASSLLLTSCFSLVSTISGDKVVPALSSAAETGQMLVYTGNDGLYGLSLSSSAAEAVKLVDMPGISKPVFSQDGSTVAFVQNDNLSEHNGFIDGYMSEDRLYAYRFSDQKLQLLSDELIYWCPGYKDSFIISSVPDGIVQVNISGERQVLLPAENTETEWDEYEELMLSPDNRLLAFTKTHHVSDAESFNGTDTMQNSGVWVLDLTHESADANQGLKQLQPGTAPFDHAYMIALYPLYYPAKWSPDSSKLLIWQEVASGSTTADGVGLSVFDFNTDRLLSIKTYLLAYPENLQFSEDGTLFMLSGGDRIMSGNKILQLVTFNIQNSDQLDSTDSTSEITYEELITSDILPASPVVDSKGQAVYFAGMETPSIDPWYVHWDNSVRRQLYALRDNSLINLTDDPFYSNESPVLINNGQILFGRIDNDYKMSIWRINTDGSDLTKLVDLKESTFLENYIVWNEGQEPKEPYYSNFPFNYNNFYGRGSWYDMMAIF